MKPDNKNELSEISVCPACLGQVREEVGRYHCLNIAACGFVFCPTDSDWQQKLDSFNKQRDFEWLIQMYPPAAFYGKII